MDILQVKVNGEWVPIKSTVGPKGDKGDTGATGQTGADGFSPVATVTKSGAITTISITDKNGTTSEQITDGVTDVQINGASVVSSGVANIPVASTSAFGAVKVQSYGGLQVSSSDTLKIDPATTSHIKAGTETSRPITPERQHNAVFYGLAKVAGDTTQSSSSNEVGTYTDDAKRKIREMLGIPNIESEVIGTYTVSEDTESITFNLDSYGNSFELQKAKIIVIFQPPTTGARSYVAATGNFLYGDGTYGEKSFPTMQTQNGTNSCLFEYEFESYGTKLCFIRSFVSNGYNSSSGNFYGLTTNTDLIALTAFTIKQYNSSATLIPAGTTIEIRGIRK